jgi:hypothetical protein
MERHNNSISFCQRHSIFRTLPLDFLKVSLYANIGLGRIGSGPMARRRTTVLVLLLAVCTVGGSDVPETSMEVQTSAPTESVPQLTTVPTVGPSPTDRPALTDRPLSTDKPTSSAVPATPAPSCILVSGVLVCQPEQPTTLPPVVPLRPSVGVGWIVGFAAACILVVVLAAGLHIATLKVRRVRREMARALRLIRSSPRTADPLSVPLIDIGGGGTGERAGCVMDGDGAADAPLDAEAAGGFCGASDPTYHDAERLLARSVSPADLEGPAPTKAELLSQYHALHSVDPELESLMSIACVERIPNDKFAGPNPHTEYD